MRQWRFLAAGTQVRAGAAVTLHNDVCAVDLCSGHIRSGDGALTTTGSWQAVPSGSGGALRLAPALQLAPDVHPPAVGVRTAADLTVTAPGTVVLHYAQACVRPVCGGERMVLEVSGAGYLAAGEPGGPDVVFHPEPAAEWVVAGVAPGVAVPVDKPVALFDAVQGDYLVCRVGAGGPELGWAGGAAPVAGDPPRLPVPLRLRPPEGVPGDVQVAGAVVPVRDGDPAAGLLLLLDPEDGRALAGHLRRRMPAAAERLAVESAIGAVACRWSAAGAPSTAQPPLPAPGSRLWAQGLLVADPGIWLSPVRALAWALDGDGAPVMAAPGRVGWPETAITWWVLMPAMPEDVVGGPGPLAFYLPLPGRDAEPGSATTLTQLREPGEPGTRTGGRRATGRVTTSPSLTPGSPGSRRMLRIVVGPVGGGQAMAVGCTARVHLPVQPTGA